jgi:prepilin peptidase CpaA
MFTGTTTAMAWGAVFSLLLAIGCVTDLRTRRIPNGLNAAILLGGLMYGFIVLGGLTGVFRSLAGAALGFTIWIAFYALGVMGAGDVKFFAAAGAWLGPAATWRAALVAALAGGVLALFFLLRDKRLGGAIRDLALAAAARNVQVAGVGGETEPSRRRHLPYGVALAIGALALAWFPLQQGG